MYITGYRNSGATIRLAGTDPHQLARDFAALVREADGTASIALISIQTDSAMAVHWYACNTLGWVHMDTDEAALVCERLQQRRSRSTS